MTNTPRKNYNHVSHTHCWEQGGHPPCGIPMEKHTQCCLCDLKVPTPRTWEDKFMDDFFHDLVGGFGNDISKLIARICTIEDEAVRRATMLERMRCIEKIKECGHQQKDDSIWCNMDVVLKKIGKALLNNN